MLPTRSQAGALFGRVFLRWQEVGAAPDDWQEASMSAEEAADIAKKLARAAKLAKTDGQ